MNWIKQLLCYWLHGGHDYKVRYVSKQNESALLSCGELFATLTASVAPDNGKRRAIICDRCGKELKVK